MMTQNQRDAVYDAVTSFLGFDGVWTHQKGSAMIG
jgi:hypothetical protein